MVKPEHEWVPVFCLEKFEMKKDDGQDAKDDDSFTVDKKGVKSRAAKKSEEISYNNRF